MSSTDVNYSPACKTNKLLCGYGATVTRVLLMLRPCRWSSGLAHKHPHRLTLPGCYLLHADRKPPPELWCFPVLGKPNRQPERKRPFEPGLSAAPWIFFHLYGSLGLIAAPNPPCFHSLRTSSCSKPNATTCPQKILHYPSARLLEELQQGRLSILKSLHYASPSFYLMHTFVKFYTYSISFVFFFFLNCSFRNIG